MNASTLLPRRAAEILKAAYESTDDPMARRIAVDAAHERVRMEFPSYFRKEIEHVNADDCGQ